MKKNHVFLALSARRSWSSPAPAVPNHPKRRTISAVPIAGFTAGQYDKAEIEYLNVLRRDPENALAIGRLGDIYFDEGRFQRRRPICIKAANSLPMTSTCA